MIFLCRRQISARHTPGRPSARGGRACAAALLLALAGCAGDGPLASLTPPNPEVPKVEADNFPSIGTTVVAGRPAPLTAEERAKLQSDLEALAKDREAKLKQSLGAGN
ncbi:hypothetical protein [Xanthobacter sp. KR7-225]|uniref:hypothetical protein n=1 Tax=Xanthobacter sp. KR7-225 TaxID=3156613 RepID=UPI0032B5FEFE